MLALYIIGGVLLFLFLLTLIPLRFQVGFREEFSLVLGYGFLRIPVLPGKEKPEEQKPEPPPKEEKEGPSAMDRLKRALKREGFWGFLQALAEFVGEAAKASGRMLRHLKLKQFDLYLQVGGGADAAEGAVRYGQVSAGVYGACGVLFTLLPCKEKGVSVDLDYSTLDNLVDFSANLSLRPLFILKAAVSILWSALPLLKKLR